MTDDIVTRLRFEYASCECSGTGADCDRCEIEHEAANEIERVRKELTRIQERIGRHMDTKDELRSELGQKTFERDMWRRVAINAYAWEYNNAEETAEFDFKMAVRGD